MAFSTLWLVEKCVSHRCRPTEAPESAPATISRIRFLIVGSGYHDAYY